jgi:hypothetical protein
MPFIDYVNRLRTLSLNQVMQILFGVQTADILKEKAKEVIDAFKDTTQPLDVNIGRIKGVIGNPQKYADALDLIELTILEEMVDPKVAEMENFDQDANAIIWMHSRRFKDPGYLEVTKAMLLKHGIDQHFIDQVYG